MLLSAVNPEAKLFLQPFHADSARKMNLRDQYQSLIVLYTLFLCVLAFLSCLSYIMHIRTLFEKDD